MNPASDREGAYREVLSKYLDTRSEDALYEASLLAEAFIRDGLGPEDITLMHCESVQDLLEESNGRSNLDRLRGLGDAHQFLLELMIGYGVKYREYADRVIAESLEQVEATSSERERAELLAMIAHELGTPLTVAYGGVSRATTMLGQGDVERARPALTFARTALDRLRRLNEDLREASQRGQPDAPELPLLPHDLGEALDTACSWAGLLAEERNVSLIRELSGAPITVVCNSDSMQTVLTNLLSNAIQYTEPGGKVIVCQFRSEDGACVEVADTGVGMTPEVQEHLFEKFYRGDAARQLSSAGLGLGMAITRQLMEAQGGSVRVVRSAPGEGTTMRLTLPLAND